MRCAIGIAAAAFLAFSSAADARLTQTAKVRYETSEGQSTFRPVEVTFLTSAELVKATGNLKYSSFKNYAVIFWEENKASVIRIDKPTFMLCYNDFDSNCLPMIGNMSGPDQEGRVWEICTGLICY